MCRGSYARMLQLTARSCVFRVLEELGIHSLKLPQCRKAVL